MSVDLPVELCLSSDQLAIERVIAKTFTRYQFNVIVMDRLRALFMSKLYRMGKHLQSLGGRGRMKVMEKWKETTWTLELKCDEIVPHFNRKRKPEHAIIQSSKCKQTKLEEKLEETTKHLKDVTKTTKHLKDVTNQLHLLEESSKRLSTALRDKGESTRTSRRKKSIL